MATTTGGTTYVTSTDLVADYPTASLALANRVDVVASGSMSKKTASYTVTVADILAGTTIAMNSASATVITLPSSSLVNGMKLNVFSVNTGAVTFTGGTVTGTVNSISAQYTGVSLTYDSAAAVWWCLPFGGSVGAANFTNTATGTYTGYKYLTMTGNTSLVIDRAGFADVLAIGGGAGGGYFYGCGGGAGGYLNMASIYLAAGTYTCVIGGGGAGAAGTPGQGFDGNDSGFGIFTAVGGGGGGGEQSGSGITYKGRRGGSGGGSAGVQASGAAPVLGQGFAGGIGGSATAGGGGGAGAVGLVKNGGNGLASSITGSSVTRGGGGAGASGSAGTGGGGAPNTAGTANTGGGGGENAAGGSGVIIIRVAV